MTLEELKKLMTELGEQAFRGEQLFIYFNKNNGLDINEATTLPLKFREEIREKTTVKEIKILEKLESKLDDTVKYLFLLEDNNVIESVLMKYEHGYTICVSTQVGCRMGCRFCASTRGGKVRDLTASEMLNQVYMIEKDMNITINNIVLMGMGEPLDNYENTIKFMHIIHHPKGRNISYRNITLSTCGIIPKIYDLAQEDMPITLSISLHSPFDHYRKKIMPVAYRYKISDLMEACKYYFNKTGRRITFEYTMVDGFNDRKEDVEELIKLAKGLNLHINLIPLNPIKEFDGTRPKKSNIKIFRELLQENNIPTTIRREMGADISGSCGQLRRDYLSNN